MTKEECEIETSKAIMEMRSRIVELEKENAELKENEEICFKDGAEFGYNKAKKEIEEELLKCYQGYPEKEE